MPKVAYVAAGSTPEFDSCMTIETPKRVFIKIPGQTLFPVAFFAVETHGLPTTIDTSARVIPFSPLPTIATALPVVRQLRDFSRGSGTGSDYLINFERATNFVVVLCRRI